MFFRVIESSCVDGKNRVTVEYEGPALQHLLHFFETAAEFAHHFRYKADADLKGQDRAVEWAASQPERKAHHADVLSLWRAMRGVKPTEKVHRIQATMKAQGHEYRSCDVYAIISIAIDDERKSKACLKAVDGLTVEKHSSSPDRSVHRVRLVSSQSGTHRREADHPGYVQLHDAAQPQAYPRESENHPSVPNCVGARLGEGVGPTVSAISKT